MRKGVIQYKRPYPWWLVNICILAMFLCPHTISRNVDVNSLIRTAKEKAVKMKLEQKRIAHAKYLNKLYHGHNPRLIHAIVRTESSGRAKVISHKGAVGLMQVMPSTAKYLGLPHSKKELQKPSVNIYVGSRILSYYLTRTRGNLHRALIMYSGGDRDYPKRVFSKMKEV